MTNPTWPWRPLGELFEIGAGKTMSAAARTGAEKVPFLRTSNVLWDEIDLAQVDEMTISPSELVDKSLEAGDLLVCEGGEIGRAAVWDGRVPVMSFQNHLHRLRPSRSDVDTRFYVYFLQSAFTQLGIFEGAANKTTIPNLSRNRLAALNIPHPPIAEQGVIAKSLATVRAAMTVHERATSTAMELKRAVMNDLFTRGLRGEAQKETEIGLVSASWEIVSFDAALKIAQGQVDPTVEPYASMLHIGPENVESHNGHLLPCQPAKDLGLISGKYFFERGDIVYSKIRPYLNKVVMPDFSGICSADMYPLRVCTGFDARFLFHYLLSESFLRQAVPQQLRTGIPKINREQLAATVLPKPILDEQREIVTILDALDHKITLHRRKRIVLEELFKSLLHKLMTGEIRVDQLDLSALEQGSPA